MEYLKKIDLSGYTLSIYFNNQSTIKTVYGGFLSILMIILSILCIIGFGLDLVLRKHPNVTMSNSIHITEPSLDIDKYNISIAIIRNGQFPVLNFNRLFNITAFSSISDSTAKQINVRTPYQMDNCIVNNKDLAKEIENTTLIPVENYFCLPSSYLQNLFSNTRRSKSNSTRIEVRKCQNSTSNNYSCLPNNFYDSYYYIHMIWSSYYVDSSSLDSPVKKFYDSAYFKISFDFETSYRWALKLINYDSDSGFLMETSKKYSGYYNSKTEINSVYSPGINRIFYGVFTLDEFLETYKRNYVKVQKVAADIGGLLKLFTVILSFISNIYSELEFSKTFLNFLYDTNNNRNLFIKHSKSVDLNKKFSNVNKSIGNNINNKLDSKVEFNYSNNNLGNSINKLVVKDSNKLILNDNNPHVQSSNINYNINDSKNLSSNCLNNESKMESMMYGMEKENQLNNLVVTASKKLDIKSEVQSILEAKFIQTISSKVKLLESMKFDNLELNYGVFSLFPAICCFMNSNNYVIKAVDKVKKEISERVSVEKVFDLEASQNAAFEILIDCNQDFKSNLQLYKTKIRPFLVTNN